MKSIIVAILLVCGFAVVRAQDVRSQAAGTNQEVQFAPVDPADPKITPEQKELLLKAGEDNPSKPFIKPDPRSEDYGVDIETFSGSKNARPSQELLANPVKEETTRAESAKDNIVRPVQQDVSGINTPKTQPDGMKPANVKDYSKVKGPAEQPAPVIKSQPVNYRNIQGPKDQPRGVDPPK